MASSDDDVVLIPIDPSDIQADPENANQGTESGMAALDASITRYGAGRSILLDRNNINLAGNKTLEQWKKRGGKVMVVETDGQTLIAVRRKDLDYYESPEAIELAIADNAIAQRNLDWDYERLVAFDDRGIDLSVSFSSVEIEDIRAELTPPPPPNPADDLHASDPDETPEPPKEPKTKRGDLISLGPHRLLCGDARDAHDLDRLLGGRRPSLLFTDPPYNVAYESNHRVKGAFADAAITGDALTGEDHLALISDALGLASAHLETGSSLYIWCNWRVYPAFLAHFERIGTLDALIVWDKMHFGFGWKYRWQHEFCLYGHTGSEATTWNAAYDERDVWSIPRDNTERYKHPTQKPVALATRAIKNSSLAGGVVLDMFAGSGSTLIACEATDRAAHCMEIEPSWCDVIVERYEAMSGIPALYHDR